jgi:hypothetical protein
LLPPLLAATGGGYHDRHAPAEIGDPTSLRTAPTFFEFKRFRPAIRT